MLSTKQVAEILGVSPRMIQQWCSSGKITAYRVGKLWKIPESAINSIIPESLNEGDKENGK